MSKELREKVSRAIWETNGLSAFIDTAIDIVLEEAAEQGYIAAREWVGESTDGSLYDDTTALKVKEYILALKGN